MKQNETIHIDLELPAGTVCAFVNYVFANEHNRGMSMGVRQIDGDDLRSGKSEIAENKEDENESN